MERNNGSPTTMLRQPRNYTRPSPKKGTKQPNSPRTIGAAAGLPLMVLASLLITQFSLVFFAMNSSDTMKTEVADSRHRQPQKEWERLKQLTKQQDDLANNRRRGQETNHKKENPSVRHRINQEKGPPSRKEEKSVIKSSPKNPPLPLSLVNASSTQEKGPPIEEESVVKAYPKKPTLPLSLGNASLTQKVVAKSSSNKAPLPLSLVNVPSIQKQTAIRGQPLDNLSKHKVRNQTTHRLSCNELFGKDQLVRQGDYCFKHNEMSWFSCRIGSIFLDTSRIRGSVGGEPVESVLDRPEDVELLHFESGALTLTQALPDPEMNSLTATFESGMIEFLETGLPFNRTAPLPVAVTAATSKASSNTASLLLRRGAYANPCMAILSMYNVYIVLQQFAITSTPNIIWLDGHAQGNLDGVWEDLFDTKPIHVKQLGANNNETNITRIDDAILVNTKSAIGDEGMIKYRWRLAYANTSDCRMDQTNTLVSFRNFVLEKYNMTRKHQIDDTKNNTRPRQLTFLVREDYRAHPRSNGRTDRVLVNVTSDIEYIHSEYPSYNVTTVSFEGMPFREQLSYVTQSDIFISVHGAGNVHSLFLPDHATFVEYSPDKFQHRKRFRYLSECLNLTYVSKQAWIVQRFDGDKVSLRLRPTSSYQDLHQFWRRNPRNPPPAPWIAASETGRRKMGNQTILAEAKEQQQNEIREPDNWKELQESKADNKTTLKL